MSKYSRLQTFSAETYQPDVLLDALIERGNMRRDAELARALGFTPAYISKVRNRHLPVSPDLLVRVYDVFDMDIDLSRRVAGVPVTDKPKIKQQIKSKPAVTDFNDFEEVQ